MINNENEWKEYRDSESLKPNEYLEGVIQQNQKDQRLNTICDYYKLLPSSAYNAVRQDFFNSIAFFNFRMSSKKNVRETDLRKKIIQIVLASVFDEPNIENLGFQESNQRNKLPITNPTSVSYCNPLTIDTIMKNENNIRNLKPVGESLQVFENKFLTSCLALRRSLFAAIVKYNKMLKARTYLSKTFRSNPNQSGSQMRKKVIRAALSSLYNDPNIANVGLWSSLKSFNQTFTNKLFGRGRPNTRKRQKNGRTRKNRRTKKINKILI